MKNRIKDILINIPGWRTNRKLVIFESDDWGATRMASTNAYRQLSNEGFILDNCPYNANDRMESNKDLEDLGNVLISIKDKNKNPAKFTINYTVANPDYKKIEDSDFSEYFFESSIKTLTHYNDTDKVLKLYRSGIKNNIFQPQLHGREHLNVRLWMKRLQNGDTGTYAAFNLKMYTINHSQMSDGRRDNLDAFGNIRLTEDTYDYNKIVSDAQELFFDLWGYSSKSFIAPCYTWHPNLEIILKENGINYIQGTHVQKIPISEDSFKIKKKYHYTGQTNSHGQIYLVRNVFFEPTENGSENIVQKTLEQIKNAFQLGKPAIISSHRVNYIGSLNINNKENNLRLLRELLLEIIKKWPGVEFLSSDELGKLIEK